MSQTIKDGHFKVFLPSIDKFYTECDILESTGTPDDHDKLTNGRDYCADWVGISFNDIEKHKYTYRKGLEELKKFETDLALGGSKPQYRWDENDGDTISMERLYEGLPAMSKRIKQLGNATGKFITVYVCIGENCGVTPQKLLHRAYFVIRLIDTLESLGYRIAVHAYDDVGSPGYYKDNKIHTLHTEIVVKQFNEPLNKGLILTCISPWFFRHHLFKFWCAKFKMSYGYGYSMSSPYLDTDDAIYIRQGTCLKEEGNDGSTAMLNYLSQRFKF